MVGFNNKMPISKEEIYEQEKKYYDNQIIKTNGCINSIDYNEITKRKTDFFVDKDFNLPQNIFFIKHPNNYIIFGRKILSVLHRNKELTALNCSRIDDNMIIGILKQSKYNTPDIQIEFYPLTDLERKYIYESIKNDNSVDIYFPYTYHDYYTKEEKGSPKEGWHYYENLDIYLARGEKHIRKETIGFLNHENLSCDTTIYDPACSTGNFLKEIKDNYPCVYTIGADLSKEMMNVAKSKVDLALCENAYNSSIVNNSIDYLFLRFLNYHVVTKKEALEIYKILFEKVKKGGKIICFGHTPVLLNINELENNRCDIDNCSAYDEEYNSKFQYYVLTKKR